MKPDDRTAKLHLVLITAVLALVGFVLEVGPVGGVFQLVIIGLALELPTLGFLPYLALAASAAIGLHLGEEEPKPKEPPREPGSLQPAVDGEAPVESARARVRPELHQFRMLLTALGGYTLLKSLNLVLMWPLRGETVSADQLIRLFEFGFVYVALAWFVLWQFLRWYAQRRKWARLQDELVGGDITRLIAVLVLVKPLIFFVTSLTRGLPPIAPTLVLLLHLALVAVAALLWFARPLTLRRTVIGLLATGGMIFLLTIALALLERRLVNG